MSATWIFIHSPLIGPFTWSQVEMELARRGERALVPSLLEALSQPPPHWATMAERVRAAIAEAETDDPFILVGHSAAGAYLPAIRQGLPGRVAAYLFVDARLPRADTSLFDAGPPDMERELRAIAHDGRLPAWPDWFGGEAAVGEVIPDERLRRAFLAELGPVPLDLFEEPIPVTAAWPDASCAYLRLSEAYLEEAAEARARGWLVRELQGKHLHMLVDPPAVADAMQELLEAFGPGRGAGPPA